MRGMKTPDLSRLIGSGDESISGLVE